MDRERFAVVHPCSNLSVCLYRVGQKSKLLYCDRSIPKAITIIIVLTLNFNIL